MGGHQGRIGKPQLSTQPGKRDLEKANHSERDARVASGGDWRCLVGGVQL